MRLDAPVSRLKGVGPKAAALFAEKDIYTVGDLLRFYPSGYDEMTEPVPAAEAENGGFATLCLTIVGQGRIFRKGARVITHFEASDGTDPETNVNYEIQQAIGTDVGGYHYVVDEADAYEDQVFVSNGNLGDFVGLWLNGEKLTGGKPGTPGVDYTYESGSSIITIKGQTFGEKSRRGDGEDGRNTISMEFRNDEGGVVHSEVYTNPDDSGDHSKDLRNTSQNYYIPANTQPVVVLPQNVTLSAHIIDETDAPLADANLELHSTVQYGVTDKNGNATFKAVEFGAHQIFVKDASGKELGSQAFTLVEGKNSSTSGNVITAPRGSNVSLTIKINKETKEAVIEKVDVTANTSDHSSAPAFVFILFGSAVLAAAAFLIRKRITA